MKDIKTILCFKNDMIAVLDEYGRQIEELQGEKQKVWPLISDILSNLTKVRFEIEINIKDMRKEEGDAT